MSTPPAIQSARGGVPVVWRICEEHPRLVCSLLALIVIGVAFVPVQTPDWSRFNDEAQSIASGNGFRTWGKVEASLPPGYPLLLALLKLLGVPDSTVPVVHLALFLAACHLVYLSLRPWSRHLALVGMAAFAIQPLAARMVGFYLSETWGMFLCALLFFLWSGAARGAREDWRILGLGALAVFLPLTSPATIVMCFCLGALALARLVAERALKLAAMLIAGALIVMVPWQAQCVRANGSVCPLLLTTWTPSKLFGASGPASVPEDGFYAWFRTWSQGEADMPTVYLANAGAAPARAFPSAAARAAILDLGKPGTGAPTDNQLRALDALAQSERQAHPLTQYGLLPLRRAYGLWFEMPQIGHAQQAYVGRLSPVDLIADRREVGTTRAALRWLKALGATLVYGAYVTLPLFALFALAKAVRARDSFTLLVLLSVAAYTFIAGYSAFCEARRNVVFFPAILFLLSRHAAIATRVRGSAQARIGSGLGAERPS
jgi:hypothetical protein